jgi:hypothetical protein
MRLETACRRWKLWTALSVPLIALVLCGLAAPAAAFSTNTELNLQAPLASSAILTISPTSINFPNADPDTVPLIPATENPVTVHARAQVSGNKKVSLTVLAGGDLVSGSSTIPIGNVTWTATGTGYVAGTMSNTSPQTAGQWQRSGDWLGTLSFFLKNSWSYATGHYVQTITYTLTAP